MVESHLENTKKKEKKYEEELTLKLATLEQKIEEKRKNLEQQFQD